MAIKGTLKLDYINSALKLITPLIQDTLRQLLLNWAQFNGIFITTKFQLNAD